MKTLAHAGLLSTLIFLPGSVFGVSDAVQLYFGYVTRLECIGNLKLTAIGDSKLVQLEALPKDQSCGVLLKPLAPSGRTNLLLESSAGSVLKILEISKEESRPRSQDLRLKLTAIDLEVRQ